MLWKIFLGEDQPEFKTVRLYVKKKGYCDRSLREEGLFRAVSGSSKEQHEQKYCIDSLHSNDK